MSERPCLVVAGGGTGGHVFPGLAVADACRKLADVDVVFAGSPRGLEKDVVPARGYRLELLDVAPMKGGGVRRAVKGALVAARATYEALSLVKALRPRAVLSVGGYAAGPVALAAALRGVPVAVFEPNGVLGLANRLLAPFAKRAYVAWPSAATKLSPRIVRALGVPLREGFDASPYAASGTARVLVMGGSLGAQAINERLPLALAEVARAVPALEVLHQTGRGADAPVRDAYAEHGLTARVVPFLDDVAGELARADLVVARAGAITVAEIAAVGRAAVFVPFPFAADDHQRANAEALAAKGGAVCVVQRAATVERLAEEIGELLGDRAHRETMAAAARAAGKPHAAYEVAGDLLHLARIPLRAPREKQNGSGLTAHDAGAV